MAPVAPVAVVQDHLVQRGGAERVLLGMMGAFPDATLHTSFYRPEATYREFANYRVQPAALNRVGVLRRHHRALLPLFPAIFSRMTIDAEVVLCGSAGWSQGIRTDGRKVVYFHALAAWLHAPEHYLSSKGVGARIALPLLRPWLRRWDATTGRSADRYLVNGRWMQTRVRKAYGVEAEIVPPPMLVATDRAPRSVPGVEPGFFLAPSRLMPYKHLDRVIAAFALLPHERLIVAGDGPERARLEALASPNVRLVGDADDSCLQWLYGNCRAVVCAGIEGYGLTPVEAAAFGKATIALGRAGLTDTVIPGETGLLFEDLAPESIASAIRRYDDSCARREALDALVAAHTVDGFITRLRQILSEERARR
jgi:glycosyltransferase involved in cell wall biosynthesis